MNSKSKPTTPHGTVEIGCGTSMRPPRPEHQFPDEIMLQTLKPSTQTYKPTPTTHHYLCCPFHKERCLAYNQYIQPIGDSRALLNFMHKHVECDLRMLPDNDPFFDKYNDYKKVAVPTSTDGGAKTLAKAKK